MFSGLVLGMFLATLVCGLIEFHTSLVLYNNAPAVPILRQCTAVIYRLCSELVKCAVQLIVL